MLKSRRGPGSALLAFKAELLIGAVIAAAVGLSTAHAATLGHSRIVSALGQPLHVEIPVTQLTEQEIASIQAVPAPAQAWRDAGMTPPVALESMRLVLLDGYHPSGKVIQLRSQQPFQGSIVDVLLDISSASGQQRYQVSLLAQADRNALVRAGGENTRHPRPIDGRGAILPPGSHAAAGTKISVRDGDHMFAIARRNAVEGVSVYQLMMALQRENPQAFIQDNVHLVKAGATLVMPDLDVLTALSDREARRLFKQHADAFGRYGQRRGAGAATLSSSVAAAQEGVVSPAGSSSAPAEQSSSQSGDRLRLSGTPGAVAGAGLQGAAGDSARGGAADNARAPGINMLAANSTMTSDAVADSAPDASGGDHSAAGGNRVGAISDNGTAAASDSSASVHPDDQAALEKGVNESRTRILELEDNVRHLNEALQQQGHIAAETALEGARSVTEAIKEAIGISERPGSGAASTGNAGTAASAGAAGEAGSTAPGGSSAQSGTPAEGGTATPAQAGTDAGATGGSPGTGVAADLSTNGAAPAAGSPSSGTDGATVGAAGSAARPGSQAGSSQSISSDKAEREVSWFQENMLLVIGGGLALLVLIVAWILRRAGSNRRDAFESDSPITDAMVREKLQGIDLDLDHPAPGAADRHTR